MGKATLLTHLKACAEAAKSFSTTVIAGVTQAVTDALEEMESTKADKPKSEPLTIPTSGWVEDDTAGYPNYVDIPAQGITSADRLIVVIAAEHQALAASCKICRTCESMEGAIRIRAGTIPTAAIQAVYWLDEGRSE